MPGPAPIPDPIIWPAECYDGPEPFIPPAAQPEPTPPPGNPPADVNSDPLWKAYTAQMKGWALGEALRHNAELKRVDANNVARFDACRSVAPGVAPVSVPRRAETDLK